MATPGRTMLQKVAGTTLFVGCLVLLILGGVLLLLTNGPFQASGSGTQETTINQLDGIVALSSSNVWVVGWARGRGSSSLVEHWNGRAWSLVPAPGKGDESVLESVVARSAQDIWAAGAFFQGATEETLIEHWNGTTWSIVASPNGPGNNRLLSLAAVSATDVWAVGTTDPCPAPLALDLPQQGNALARPAGRGAMCTDPPHPLIEHWDGTAWSLVPNPIPDPKAAQADLSKVMVFGTQDVWAIGSYFDAGITPADGAALIEHWDGTAWHLRTDFTTAIGGRMWATAFLSSRDMWGGGVRDQHHWQAYPQALGRE